MPILRWIRQHRPRMQPILDAMSDADSPFKLVAADPDVDDGFATNLNVVVEEPPGLTRQQYFDAGSAQLESLGITEFDEERVSLPAGEALRSTFEHSLGDRPLAAVQYVLFENGTGYTLTYTTLPGTLESRLAGFEESARSFRIG